MTRMRISENTHFLKPSVCPVCGFRIDAAAEIGDIKYDEGAPEPMAITVCLNCVAVLQFTEDMELRTFPMADLEPEHRAMVNRVIDLLNQFHAARGTIRNGGEQSQ